MELKNIQRKKGESNLPLVYLLVVGAGIFFVYILYLFSGNNIESPLRYVHRIDSFLVFMIE